MTADLLARARAALPSDRQEALADVEARRANLRKESRQAHAEDEAAGLQAKHAKLLKHLRCAQRAAAALAGYSPVVEWCAKVEKVAAFHGRSKAFQASAGGDDREAVHVLRRRLARAVRIPRGTRPPFVQMEIAWEDTPLGRAAETPTASAPEGVPADGARPDALELSETV